MALKIAVLCFAFYVPSALAQDQPVQTLTAPPPLKIVPKNEQAQIDAEKDPKHRLKVMLGLAENHLLAAEQSTNQSNFEAASGEVGKYHALIDEALKSLASLDRNSNKTRDLYKRLELMLRADGPRLMSMRRVTPVEFAVWIKEVEEFARDGRTEALNSFYGHTVIREPSPKRSDPKLESQSRDNALAPTKKQP